VSGWDVLRKVDPLLTSVDVWSLPTPVDGVAWIAVQALRLVVGVVVTATLNVATLGPVWPPVYWWLIFSGVIIGRIGTGVGGDVFKGGEDVSSFSGNRSSWLGFARGVIRLQVKVKAQTAAAATVGGYGLAVSLLAVGLLWWWLFPLGAGWAAVKWQTNARPRWWIDS